MAEKLHKIIKEYNVGDAIVVCLKKKGDNPMHVNILRAGKTGKRKAARMIKAAEWPVLTALMPKVQADLDRDAKAVAAAVKKAEGNGGKGKAAPKKVTTKAADKGKKAPAVKAKGKPPAKGKGKGKGKETSIDDLL